MRQPAATSPLHTLVAAVPVSALRELVLELLQNGAAETSAPSQKRNSRHQAAAKRRRGCPKGKPRGQQALSPRARAAAAIAAHPGQSNRAIADEIGVSVQTVMRARHDGAVEKRIRPGQPRKASTSARPETGAQAKTKLAAHRKRRAEMQARWRAKRAAAKAAKAKAKAGNGSNGADAAATPTQAFWRHAEMLQPMGPWKAVAREFGTNEAQAKDCYRKAVLPPGLPAAAVERFLEVAAQS
jgi:transposase